MKHSVYLWNYLENMLVNFEGNKSTECNTITKKVGQPIKQNICHVSEKPMLWERLCWNISQDLVEIKLHFLKSLCINESTISQGELSIKGKQKKFAV